MIIANAFRMSCNIFETSFLPSIKNFSYEKAHEVASDIMKKQNYQIIATKVSQNFQNQKNTKKIDCDYNTFCKKNEIIVKLNEMINQLERISKTPNQYITKSPDCSLDFWIYKQKFYVCVKNNFINEFNPPRYVEEFCLNELDLEGRRKIWNNVCLENLQNLKMHLDIINFQNKIGIKKLIEMLAPEESLLAA